MVVEDLHTKARTRAAKGPGAKSGRQGPQKAGLSRGTRARDGGSGERWLAYQAGAVVKANPAATSQTGRACGHTARAHRPPQAGVACQACGCQAKADHKAAITILVWAGLPSVLVPARGTEAAARGGAIPLATPAIRELDMPIAWPGI